MSSRNRKKLIKIAVAILITLLIAVLQNRGIIAPTATKTAQTIQNNTPGTYQVIKVEDGDTVTVDMVGKKERIRLIGVDTPEKNDPRKPVQCFAEAASNFTKQLIGSNRVRLEADPTNSNRDRYQRLLRYVYLPNNTLVNKKIVEEGYGFALTAFPFTKLEEFRTSEAFAKSQVKGLWGQCQVSANTGFNQTNPQ